MPKSFSLQTLLSCASLTFALGWLAPEALVFMRATQQAQTQQSGGTEPTLVPGQFATESDVMNRFNAIDWRVHPAVGASELAPALADSAPLREAALERFGQEPTGTAKSALAQFLTEQPLPEIIAAATQWAQQADSANVRANGFELLARLPPQPAIYRLARRALELEKDPQVLAAAILSLSPQGGVPDPLEVQQVVPRLHALTQHPLPRVRMVSVQRLAYWDRAGQFVTADVLRLLSDPDVEVRIAAIGATSIASLNSDSIKQRLVAMMADAKETGELRSIVALQMDRFGLSAKEFATYQAVQRELFGKADGQ